MRKLDKTAPLSVRFSRPQRSQIQRAARKVSRERGERVDESSLVRELTLAGIERLLAVAAA